MLPLIVRELTLRIPRRLPETLELFLKPDRHVHGAVEFRPKILIDIRIHQLVHNIGRQPRIVTAVANVDHLSRRYDLDLQSAPDKANQGKTLPRRHLA